MNKKCHVGFLCSDKWYLFTISRVFINWFNMTEDKIVKSCIVYSSWSIVVWHSSRLKNSRLDPSLSFSIPQGTRLLPHIFLAAIAFGLRIFWTFFQNLNESNVAWAWIWTKVWWRETKRWRWPLARALCLYCIEIDRGDYLEWIYSTLL